MVKIDSMGQRTALRLRSKLQAIFFKLGCFCQRNCWVVLAVGFFILIGLSVGIITAKIETDVEKLWMEGKLCEMSICLGAGWRNKLGVPISFTSVFTAIRTLAVVFTF